MARKAPEINAGSMADIAFLLLIFFLVTTTMDVDTGITRKLPPPVEDDELEIKVIDRNVLKVLVNSHDRLMVDGKFIDISMLKDAAKDFMSIHPDNPDDRGTSYQMYIAVQNELAAAFSEMKNELSMNLFGLRYKQLINKDKIKGINKAIPVRISEAEPEDIGGP